MAITSIKLKVYDYDEASGSLIVAFNSNESLTPIDEQPRFAYQPSAFETTDADEFMLALARSGVSIAKHQDKQAAFKQNEVSVDVLKQKVGQELDFSVDELFAQGEEQA
jgi:hypothetical protein